jgi:hypothetical protein
MQRSSLRSFASSRLYVSVSSYPPTELLEMITDDYQDAALSGRDQISAEQILEESTASFADQECRRR